MRTMVVMVGLLVAGSGVARADAYCESVQFQQAMRLMPQWDCPGSPASAADDRAVEYGVVPKPTVEQMRREDRARQRHVDPPVPAVVPQRYRT